MADKGVFFVRSAESPHGGRDIPGCAADMRHLAHCAKTGERYEPGVHSWRVEGDGNYEAFYLQCEICGEREECVPKDD